MNLHWFATVAEAKILVPRKTGHLGRSIMPGPVGTDTAYVFARTNYAAYVEFGTRPHTIVPRNKKALRFAASKADARLSGSVRRGGNAVFAKKVRHPGTKPHPFLRPGAEAAIRKVGVGEIVDSWNKAA